MIRKIFEYIPFILQLSLHKTIRFNYHYFGWKGIMGMYVLISKKTVLRELKGTVTLNNQKRGAVKIGFGCNEVLDWRNERTLFTNRGLIELVGAGIYLAQGTRIFNSGHLIIGKNFTVTGNSIIICNNTIVIGDDCLMSWGCSIMDTDFHKIFTLDTPDIQINPDSQVCIGNHCWICSNVSILKHSFIKDNTIISAGSIVNTSISEQNCIIKNNNISRTNINWKK